eukprot:scpid27134/ scgid0529/ 
MPLALFMAVLGSVTTQGVEKNSVGLFVFVIISGERRDGVLQIIRPCCVVHPEHDGHRLSSGRLDNYTKSRTYMYRGKEAEPYMYVYMYVANRYFVLCVLPDCYRSHQENGFLSSHQFRWSSGNTGCLVGCCYDLFCKIHHC